MINTNKENDILIKYNNNSSTHLPAHSHTHSFVRVGGGDRVDGWIQCDDNDVCG